MLENAVSNAERRTTLLGEDRIVPRLSDVYAAVPSITGKLELEYEGELQGGDAIARELIRRAAGKVLEERMGGADLGEDRRLVRPGRRPQGPRRRERRSSATRASAWCPALLDTVAEFGLSPRSDHARAVAACELVLEGLAAQKRISRSEELGYTRDQAGAAGAGVWEGGDIVWVRDGGRAVSGERGAGRGERGADGGGPGRAGVRGARVWAGRG